MPGVLTPEEFHRLTGVSRETVTRLAHYGELLQRWNRAVNLVGRDTLGDLWRRHFLDSAQLAGFLPPAPADRPRVVVDLGSGAGFPGLVLALLGLGEVHLVEADRKKAAFLREAARSTGTVARIHPERIERLHDVRADVVTARACAPLDRLCDYARPLLRPGAAAIFLKGKQVDQELTALDKAGKMIVERFPSRSDPQGVILRIWGLGS